MDTGGENRPCMIMKGDFTVEKGKQLYEGKAKKVFETDDPDLLIVSYKDDATAFNGQKKGTIHNKGEMNNRISNKLMRYLEKQGVPTHLVEQLSDRDTLVKRVEIVPLEVIMRNVAAGSMSKKYGVPEGTPLKSLECPECGQAGGVIETGEEIDAEE